MWFRGGTHTDWLDTLAWALSFRLGFGIAVTTQAIQAPWKAVSPLTSSPSGLFFFFVSVTRPQEDCVNLCQIPPVIFVASDLVFASVAGRQTQEAGRLATDLLEPVLQSKFTLPCLSILHKELDGPDLDFVLGEIPLALPCCNSRLFWFFIYTFLGVTRPVPTALKVCVCLSGWTMGFCF